MKEKKVPLRKCIACAGRFDKRQVIRIVKNNNMVFVDKTGKMNGRGAYICKNLECFEKMKKTNALARTFSMKIEDDILENIGKILNE